MKSISITIKSTMNFCLFLLLVYFIYHTIIGSRGLIAYLNLKESLSQSKNQLNELITTREKIEKKVQLLNPKKTDMDFLDELARKELGLINKNEKCFILKY
ncbi:MAG: septum formation initiator family protein [Candidatus Midichloria sp.]|nr:MAG: septum formation initiator family protein [Candidatus Midichloria sp.]